MEIRKFPSTSSQTSVSFAGKQSKTGDGESLNGDGGKATSAVLNHPWSAIVDEHNNVYISDQYSNKIRKIDANATINTVAGNGVYTFGGDGGAATSASLARPTGINIDTIGNLFIADTLNHRIRKVDTFGIISTLAGLGYAPDVGKFSGDNGDATLADLNRPYGVYVDTTGNVYIADTFNQRIRKIDAATNIINTIAGTEGFGKFSD